MIFSLQVIVFQFSMSTKQHNSPITLGNFEIVRCLLELRADPLLARTFWSFGDVKSKLLELETWNINDYNVLCPSKFIDSWFMLIHVICSCLIIQIIQYVFLIDGVHVSTKNQLSHNKNQHVFLRLWAPKTPKDRWRQPSPHRGGPGRPGHWPPLAAAPGLGDVAPRGGPGDAVALRSASGAVGNGPNVAGGRCYCRCLENFGHCSKPRLGDFVEDDGEIVVFGCLCVDNIRS